jgi:hypothetical protein
MTTTQQITEEDTQRALDIARRLAPFRRACSYGSDVDAEAAEDQYLLD